MAEPTMECIRRAQAGDSEALTELIMGQQHYVYSIALSVFHHPEDAADLTQEAFIRLMRALPQYNGESRFTTWLYRLVINLCRDELRRRGRQVQLVPPTDDDAEDGRDPLALVADPDRMVDPLRALSDSELRAAVRHALNQLDDHYRLALTLYYFEDLKYSDIADILDVPINTLKSHIRRGKERLMMLLADYNGDGAATETNKPTAATEHVRGAHRFALGATG